MGIFPQNRFNSNDKYTAHGKLSAHVTNYYDANYAIDIKHMET